MNCLSAYIFIYDVHPGPYIKIEISPTSKKRKWQSAILHLEIIEKEINFTRCNFSA